MGTYVDAFANVDCTRRSFANCKISDGCTWQGSSPDDGYCTNIDTVITDCADGEYNQHDQCYQCPAEYPTSAGGAAQKTDCYNECNGHTYYFGDGQTMPCECYRALRSQCLATGYCTYDMGLCTHCGLGNYLESVLFTCEQCPDGYDNSDTYAVGPEQCYKRCDAFINNSLDNASEVSAEQEKVYYNSESPECTYTYTCNTDSWKSGTSTNPSCTKCSNLPDTSVYSSEYTTAGLTSSANCPWRIECPTGFILNPDAFSNNGIYNNQYAPCMACSGPVESPIKSDTHLVATNYKYENGTYTPTICVTYTDLNDEQQTVCGINNLPRCIGKIFTVTLGKNTDETPINSTYTQTVYQKYDDGWYQYKSGNTVTVKIDANNKITVPKTSKVFTGYWTATSGGTQVINASGLPLSNTAITSDNAILYAQWSDAIPYSLTINKTSGGPQIYNTNGQTCAGTCDIDTNISVFDGLKNTGTYGILSFSNNIIQYTPTNSGIEKINQDQAITDTLDLCDANKYCKNLGSQSCPYETHSDAGADGVTDCYLYGTIRDNKGSYEITSPITGHPYIAAPLAAWVTNH